MALVEDLVKIGINARQAEAIGFHYEFITPVGTTRSGAPLIEESLTYGLPSPTDYALRLPTTDESKTGMHIIGSTGSTPMKVYTSDNGGSAEIVLTFGTGVGVAPSTFFNIPAYSWAIAIKLGQYAWGAMIK